MDKLFITILNNALVASWIILAVIICRQLLRKAPKWINCLLWGLVAVRLVLPFGIESIFSLVPSAKPVPVDIEYAKVPQINSGIPAINTIVNPVLEHNFVANEISSANPMQIVMFILSYVWIICVVALCIYALVSFFMIKRRVRNSQNIEKGIYECDSIESPFILGIVRPHIYVPVYMDKESYECVIEHERAHIKRFDHIWKPLGFVILAVYWFNPLCWIAYIILCKDIEYACDEKVTRDRDKDWKAKYCQVLLNCSSQRHLVSACPVAFGEVSVKDRVKSVINYKKPTFWIILFAVVTVVIVVVCFMTNPQKHTYTVNVNMPLGWDYNQSEEDILAKRNSITITLNEGQDDTVVCLIPIEAKTETAYDELITLTAGVPVKIDVEKGARFEIGVIENAPVDEEKHYSFSVKDVEIRIADVDIVEVTSEVTNTATEEDATTVYYQLVHNIEAAMHDPSLIENNPQMYKDTDGNDICSEEFLFHLYDGSDDIAYQNLGYLIKDIDDDGTEELLLGENDPNPDGGYNGIVYDLYTFRDGKLQHVFSGWPRNRYYLTNSSEIICEWSNSADDNGKTHYLYENGNLTEMDSWEDVYSYYLPQFNAMGPIWIQVDDLNGDTRSDYVIRTGMDGYYNHLSLYLTGEGKVFEHEDDNVIEPGTMLCSIDIDHDGEKEIALSMAPHVNSAGLMKFAVLKKTSNGWKELEIYNPENGDDSFPIEILHKGDYKNVISCQGLEKSIVFDVEYIRNHWEIDAEISEDYKKEVLSYYDNFYQSITGTPVGQVCAWGMWDINETTYNNAVCLQAHFGIAGYDRNDIWGYLSIYFDFDRTGKIRILDLVFDSIKAELPSTKNDNMNDSVTIQSKRENADKALFDVFKKFEGQWIFDAERGACVGIETSEECGLGDVDSTWTVWVTGGDIITDLDVDSYTADSISFKKTIGNHEDYYKIEFTNTGVVKFSYGRTEDMTDEVLITYVNTYGTGNQDTNAETKVFWKG